MNKKIFISFPAGVSKQFKEQATNRINQVLETINHEVSSWNGFIDYKEMNNGQYTFVPKCDNDEILDKMQLLIDASGINDSQSSLLKQYI